MSVGQAHRNLLNVLGIILPVLATAVHAQTMIEVPQGSGVFPTIGQINCLEELGSGRFCAATYECADEGGELWGDMANHDGRRPIGADSPVATKRACTVEVDGKASVSWFAGYRPAGRTGELIGAMSVTEAVRPVITIERTSANGRSVLDHILQRYETTLPEIVDEECGHIAPGHRSYHRCEQEVLRSATYAMEITDTAVARCAVEVQERFCEMLHDDERGYSSCAGSHYGNSLAKAVMAGWWAHSRLNQAVDPGQPGHPLRDCVVQANELLSEHGMEFDTETNELRLLD